MLLMRERILFSFVHYFLSFSLFFSNTSNSSICLKLFLNCLCRFSSLTLISALYFSTSCDFNPPWSILSNISKISYKYCNLNLQSLIILSSSSFSSFSTPLNNNLNIVSPNYPDNCYYLNVFKNKKKKKKDKL